MAWISSGAHGQMSWWPYGAAATRLIAEADSQTAPESGGIAPGADIRTADELLGMLETADRGLVRLDADIRFDRMFALQGDRQLRLGRLAFVNASTAADGSTQRRQFAIRFDRLVIGDVVRDEPQQFAFDGEWLIEVNPAQKRMTKWQIVAPGETFDPLRLGSGPLPIPIGQRRADILSRFDARLVPADEGLAADDFLTAEESTAQRAFVAGSVQLVLVPRGGGSDEEDFTEIRLWYARGAGQRLLPRMARTINPAGDVSTVMLVNVVTQDVGEPIHPEMTQSGNLFLTPTPDDGWLVDIRPFRRGGEGP